MKTIWKFELQPKTTLRLSKDAQVLSVHEQSGGIFLWALVDPETAADLPLNDNGRRFHVFGTGHPIPDIPLKFIGTVHLQGGFLVFHVFEEM